MVACTMGQSTADNPVLDNAFISFLKSGVSIMAATRNGDNVPGMTRAYGCSATSSSITLYVCRQESRQAILNLETSGDIAASFTLPTTYETYQIKGCDAALEGFADTDHDTVERYYRAFFAQIKRVGLADAGFDALAHARSVSDFVQIRFTPLDIFRQTPGPGAGERRAAQ